MSQVIYARVPDATKEAVDGYADERGVTLTSAVVDLLERGLGAVTDERSIAALEARVAQLDAEKTQVATQLRAAQTELGALGALSSRSHQVVGRCPKCKQDFTGYDLLATGRCEHCGQPLSDLLLAKKAADTSGLDANEFLLLLGALGAILAVAYIATNN